MPPKNQSVPFVYMRGGTSKALFFQEHDIPSPGIHRDRFLRRVMGSPDPMQIDGIGGTHIVTSKVAIISRSQRADADVDYTFAQVGIDNDVVGYEGNCGNISAGVGPFAIDEGLVKEKREGASIDPKVRTREVRIYNTGTRTVLISHVPIEAETGMALETGDFAIAGCPGTGAPILMDYRNVIGGTLGRGMLPTGNAADSTTVEGRRVQFTICDVGNIIIFARAEDFDISGSETPAILDRKPELISRVMELRGKAALMVGMCQDWAKVDVESPMLPMVALVSAATNGEAHVQSRLFLDNRCHTSMAGTGGVCTAACSRLPGSVVTGLLKATALNEKTLDIQHPSGILPVSVETTSQDLKAGEMPEFATLSFIRTSRRISDGRLYIPDDVKVDVFGSRLFESAHVRNGHVDGSHPVNSVKVAENSVKAVNGDHTKGSDNEPLVMSYQRGFHNTSIAGIFGAVTAIAKLKGLDSRKIENEFGLAIAKAAGSMQYLANGSWNKRLHPGFAAHDAFVCVALAQASVLGAAEPIEGKFGLLSAYAGASADTDALTESLGSRWEFLGTAIKRYPACRMTHGQIELAAKIAAGRPAQSVRHITVTMAKECFPIVGAATPNKIHPNNIVDAQFSTYYQTALAWLYGSATGWGAYERLDDPMVRNLTEKISVEADNAYRSLETSLKVVWEDGLEMNKRLKDPLGEKDRPATLDMVQEKFKGLVCPILGAKTSSRTCDVVRGLEKHKVQD